MLLLEILESRYKLYYMKESPQDLGRGCRGLDPLTVVFSAVQTGHLVSSARERSTEFLNREPYRVLSHVMTCAPVSLTSPQTVEFLDLLLQPKIVIV